MSGFPNLDTAVIEPSGAIVYVAPSGSDSNSGKDWGNAKASISAAIAALPANGGNVKLGLGTYYYGAIEDGQGFGVDAPGVAYGAFNVGVNLGNPHAGGQGGNSSLGAMLNGAATLTSGTGAPTISGNKGDFYFRTDTPGTANQRLYTCTTAGAAGTAVWMGIL